MLNQEKNNATITFSLQVLNKILNIFKKYYIKMNFIRDNILINLLENTKKKKNLEFTENNLKIVINVVLDKLLKK